MSQMSVKELRDILVHKLGYSYENAKNLGKKEIKDILSGHENATNLLQNAELVPEKQAEPIQVKSEDLVEQKVGEDDQEEKNPLPTDPEWTDYVLSLLTDGEKINGSPRTDGLRRVATKLFGQFNTETLVIQPPGLDGRATVIVELKFKSLGYSITGAADVFSGNTLREFAIHPVATAETRAEGRALRKALLLVKVLAAEEAMAPVKEEADGSDGKIVAGMLNSLHLMCNKQSVDLGLLAKHKFQVENLEDLTLTQGRQLADELSKFQRKEQEIPDAIKA